MKQGVWNMLINSKPHHAHRHPRRHPLHRWRRILLLSMTVILLHTASCDQLSRDEQPPHDVASEPPTSIAPAYTFGIIYPVAHSFYETVTVSAEEAAEEFGIELIVKAPDEANIEQQIRMMETMIDRQVDGIAIVPLDSDALTPVIDRTVQAGIPVVCFESDAPASQRTAFIGSDNRLAGERLGAAIDELLKGEGMILVENGMRQMASHQQRLDGFLSYIEAQTQIDVLEVRYNEGKKDLALIHLEQMIDDHPHFDAFVALDIVSGETSVLVWKAMGLSRYSLTFSLMPDIEEAIRNGQITLSVSQKERTWGTQLIDTLVKVKAGEQVPTFVDTEFELIQ